MTVDLSPQPLQIEATKQLERFFWSRVHRGTGCWEWDGYRTEKGYGRLAIKTERGYRSIFSHRLSYSLHHATDPGRLCVCHTCDNPACVRPDHLFLGSKRANNEDRTAKGRTARGEKNRHARLTRALVVELRERVRRGESRAAISRELGLPKSTIEQAVSGRTWSHVPGALGDTP